MVGEVVGELAGATAAGAAVGLKAVGLKVGCCCCQMKATATWDLWLSRLACLAEQLAVPVTAAAGVCPALIQDLVGRMGRHSSAMTATWDWFAADHQQLHLQSVAVLEAVGVEVEVVLLSSCSKANPHLHCSAQLCGLHGHAWLAEVSNNEIIAEASCVH